MLQKVAKPCPLCNHPLVETRRPYWDKALRMYARFFYRCDKCCIDIVVDYDGIITVTDKDGKVVQSGK